MVWLLPIWLCLFLISVGCGLLVATVLARSGGSGFRAPLHTLQAFWFGYAFTIVFLELYSLLLPIRWPAPVALGSLALLGFWSQRRAVLARFSSWRARPRLTLALLLTSVLIVALVAARAAQPVGWYDTHLYHLQVVKWARQYAAVPGIANLHYRLAYNNSIHLYGALCDTLWKGRAAHIPLGLLASVTALQLLQHVLRPARGRARVVAAYCLLTLPFVLGHIASNEVASLSSDLPLNLICIVIGLELIALQRRPGDRSDLRLALILALASAATTTKLGGMGMLAVSGLVALWALRQNWSRQRCLALGALPGLMFVGYFARQTVMSGWLLFPAPIGNLHLPWSLPEAEALDQFRWIQSWARMPGRDPERVLDHGLWRWLEPWFSQRFASSQEFVVLALASAIALFRLAQDRAARTGWHAAALAATLLSLVVWFRGAPDLRFGAGFFWMLLAVVAAPLLGKVMQERLGQVLGLCLSLALCHWTGGLSAELPNGSYRVKLRPIDQVGVKEVELSPGLKVSVPEGDSDRCSNMPLPCTPYPAKQRLRRANDLGYGFEY